MSQQFHAGDRTHGSAGTGHAANRIVAARTAATSHKGCPHHRSLDDPWHGIRCDQSRHLIVPKGTAPQTVA